MRDITKAQAEAGDIAGALDTAQSIKDAATRALALRDVALAQVGHGDNEAAATETATKALDAALSVDDAYARAMALRGVAEAQAQTQDSAAAKQTIANAFDTARSIKDSYRRVRALRGIAEAQVGMGDIFGAIETSLAIDILAARVMAFRDVAEELSKLD